MKLAALLAAFALSATTACSGAIEEGITESPSSPAVEQASEPAGEQSEGEDPFFATAAAPPSSDSDAAESEPASETPTEPSESESAPAKPGVELLLQEATRQVTVMKVSAYEHTTSVDEASGTFKYDCSGFLGYALSRVLPAQLAAVKTFGGVTRPLAKHYHDFFASIAPGATKSGWSSVARAIDVRAGDVVAWLTPADLVTTNTGHVMVVTGAPTINPKRADEIIIPITDSTSSFHGPADTRYPSAHGLGRGSIGILVDAAGKPVRYRWTGGYSTKEYSTAISFGRPG